MGAATMQFHFQMSQIWPMYPVLRSKGNEFTQHQFAL